MSTVLLVEDNADNALILEDIFLYEDLPARLATVASGEEALAMVDSLRPVLILMDLRLPGIDGLETTAILKGHPLTEDIPVWAVTAYAMPGDEARARAAGCDEYFAKPLQIRSFGDRLREFLQGLENTECRECASTKA